MMHSVNKDSEPVFSNESLQSMKELNYTYGILVDDLTAENSVAIAELLKADAISSEPDERDTRGILATLQEDSGGGVLLLQPKEDLSAEELQSVAEAYEEAIPEFEHVELDQDLEMSGFPFFWKNWGTEEENVQLSEVTTEEAEPVVTVPITVAVIDSGVDITHEIFNGHTFTTGWNAISHDTVMYDDVGHGTHIAGIIASEVPGSIIAPYKIVDANGGKLSNVVEAFSKAIEDDVDVINTSFGVMDYSYVLEHLVDNAYKKGIVVVSAAGNNATDTPFYPASYEHSIAVASVYSNGFKMPKSNYGEWVDVAAKGYHIRSSVPGNSYGYKSGTSQATAIMSARVARILIENGADISFEDLLETLKTSGKTIESGDLAGVPYVQ